MFKKIQPKLKWQTGEYDHYVNSIHPPAALPVDKTTETLSGILLIIYPATVGNGKADKAKEYLINYFISHRLWAAIIIAKKPLGQYLKKWISCKMS